VTVGVAYKIEPLRRPPGNSSIGNARVRIANGDVHLRLGLSKRKIEIVNNPDTI